MLPIPFLVGFAVAEKVYWHPSVMCAPHSSWLFLPWKGNKAYICPGLSVNTPTLIYVRVVCSLGCLYRWTIPSDCFAQPSWSHQRSPLLAYLVRVCPLQPTLRYPLQGEAVSSAPLRRDALLLWLQRRTRVSWSSAHLPVFPLLQVNNLSRLETSHPLNFT